MNTTTKHSLSVLYESSLPPLGAEEEMEYSRHAFEGDAASREVLVRSNIRYAISCAKKYAGPELDTDEVVTEAIIGLLRAADKFSPSRGVRFITYATYFIRNEILDAKRKSGYGLYKSDCAYRAELKVKSALSKLGAEYEGGSLICEVSHATGISGEEVLKISSQKEVDVMPEPESDSLVSSPEDEALRECCLAELSFALSSLCAKERNTISAYYGLGSNGKKRTLEEIGRIMGLTKLQAYTLKEKALTHMREKLCA